jgi:CRISPR system Cascade subunit CasE
MIATMLSLSHKDCKKLKITDLYSIHRIIYGMFPLYQEEKRDFLFVEKNSDFNQRNILIVSKREPAIPKYGNIQTKKIPESFFEHEYYKFETKVNPTKKQKEKNVPIKSKEDLNIWLKNKTTSLGFEILDNYLEIEQHNTVSFYLGQNQTITYNSVTFKGIFKVTNILKLKETFLNGIGRAKSFGFGLLQLVPMA